jgi:hypothetical protein
LIAKIGSETDLFFLFDLNLIDTESKMWRAETLSGSINGVLRGSDLRDRTPAATPCINLTRQNSPSMQTPIRTP